MDLSLIRRPYQEECVGTFIDRIDKVQKGGLIVLPTGTGKSLVMADIAKWWLQNRRGGVGIAAHRIELVKQNAEEFDAHMGVKGMCYKELGDEYRVGQADWDKIRRGGVVSFTIQTLQNRRMMKAGADSLGIILVDECHRIKGLGQYEKTRQYFGCKWVGLTATPDRTDGDGLVPNMFDECWYGNKEGQLINDFVEQGWLTPPKVQHVHVKSLHWEWLKGRSGKDFTNEQVSKVWQDYESIHQFVAPIMREVKDKKTLYFCPGVEQAKGVADVINSVSHPRRIAEYVASYKIDEDGARSDFPKDLRRAIIKSYKDINNPLQHVANMDVFTEGTNVPIISAIGWLRFTRSRKLITQGCGRAFRVWPGVLDGLERATAAARRAAIAASPKPFAHIFDPTKRIGSKLKLAHVLDIFHQTEDKDIQRQIDAIIARKAARGEEYDPREVFAEATQLESPFFKGLRAALLEIAPSVDYRLVEVDPYKGGASDWTPAQPKERPKTIGNSTPGQKKMIKMLSEKEYSEDFYAALTRRQAATIIEKKMKEPPVRWIREKLTRAGMVAPKNNKMALALLRQQR